MQRNPQPLSTALSPLVLAAASLFLAPTAAAQTARATSAPFDVREPHLVVRLLPGQSAEPLAAAIGGTVLRSHPTQSIHLLAVPGADAQAIESLAWAVKGFPTVLYAEPDEAADPPESIGCGLPAGPAEDGGDFGAMQCTVPFIDGAPAPGSYDLQAAVDQMSVSAAQALATGVPLVVAIVDTGVDTSHPLFAGRIAPGGYDYILDVPGGVDVGNGIDDDADGAVDEALGHGSHVAGLVALVDPAAMILPMRSLDSDGYGTAFLIASAIYDAVDAGATVINLSLSSRFGCDVFAEALIYAEVHGVDVVTSAGNSGDGVQFPGCYDPAAYAHLSPWWLPAGFQLDDAFLLTVGGVDIDDSKAPFSCFGPEIDVLAPGVDVYSAHMGGTWAWWSGTSMSSGLAAGSVSFLRSIWQQGSYAGTVEDLLRETAVDALPKNPGLSGKIGAGRIDLEAAAKTLLGLPL